MKSVIMEENSEFTNNNVTNSRDRPPRLPGLTLCDFLLFPTLELTKVWHWKKPGARELLLKEMSSFYLQFLTTFVVRNLGKTV